MRRTGAAALSADVPRLPLCAFNASALHATAETVAVTDAYARASRREPAGTRYK